MKMVPSRTTLLSVALVMVMALSVLSTADVVTITKATLSSNPDTSPSPPSPSSTSSEGKTTGNASTHATLAAGTTPPTIAYISYTGEAADGWPIRLFCQASDSDGTIVSYAWNLGNGNTSTEPSPTQTYSTPPHYYTVTCTVTDNDGLTATASTQILVKGFVSVSVNATPSRVQPFQPFTVSGRVTVDRTGAGVQGRVYIQINPSSPSKYVTVDTTSDGSYTYTFTDGLNLEGNNAINTWAGYSANVRVVGVPVEYRAGSVAACTVSVCGASNIFVTAPANAYITGDTTKDKITIKGHVDLGACLGLGFRPAIDTPFDIQRYVPDNDTWVFDLRSKTDIDGNYTIDYYFWWMLDSNQKAASSFAVQNAASPSAGSLYLRVYLPYNASTAFENSKQFTVMLYEATKLNASASPPSPLVNQNFTVNGQLTWRNGGLGSKYIALQRSLDNVTFTTVAYNLTDSTGWYEFVRNETAAQTYYYRTKHVSGGIYADATSDVLKVKVTEKLVKPTLTIATSTTTPTTNVAFTLSGTLKAGVTALASQPVHLERRTLSGGTWSSWANVGGTYTYTDGTGVMKLTQTVTTAGTYQYRWHFNGTKTLEAANSTAITETVKKPTAFSIGTSTTTPTTSVAFTLSGTLKSGTTALASQPIHLERRSYASGVWGGWANVGGTYKYTNSTGITKLSQTATTAGQYQYRWHYNGTTTYQSAYSSAITETVKKPTTLTVTNSTKPRYNVAFTLSGTLKSGTTGLSGLSVHLERKVGTGSWVDVTGTTKTTSSGGVIPSVSQTMTTHATYQYRWHFTGTGMYQAGYSPVKTFTV